MIAHSRHLSVFILTLVAVFGFATVATAQCTTCYMPTVTYQPVVQQTYTGWYPGYLLDRIRMRWWGTPTTYTAGYPTSAYYRASYPVATTNYYAAPTCTTCSYSPCCTTYRPVCNSCGSAACSSCSSCGVSSGCSTCTASYETPAADYPVETRPALRPDESPANQRTFKPDEGSVLDGSDDVMPEDASSTLLQPPKLFQPPDLTTQNPNSTPVWTAIYHRPVDRGVTKADEATARQTAWERAQVNAVGWSSVSD